MNCDDAKMIHKIPNCPDILPPFRTVVIPAVLGDDSYGQPYAPKTGAYQDTIVRYASNNAIYIYTADGIYTKLSDGAPITSTFYNAGACMVDNYYSDYDGLSTAIANGVPIVLATPSEQYGVIGVTGSVDNGFTIVCSSVSSGTTSITITPDGVVNRSSANG